MLNTAIALIPVLVILAIRALFLLVTLPLRVAVSLLLSLRHPRRARA